MLKISKKTEYAIIAMLDMARRPGEELVTARDLSRMYNIPPEIMGKVLQSLAREELVISHQGVKGGYQLRMSLDEINVNRIITAVEGPVHLVDCTLEVECGCDQSDTCGIKGPMEFIQSELHRFLDSITLQDFRDREQTIPLMQIES
jgi:Rrf2 family protein